VEIFATACSTMVWSLVDLQAGRRKSEIEVRPRGLRVDGLAATPRSTEASADLDNFDEEPATATGKRSQLPKKRGSFLISGTGTDRAPLHG
jgi:hypothetical protein